MRPRQADRADDASGKRKLTQFAEFRSDSCAQTYGTVLEGALLLKVSGDVAAMLSNVDAVQIYSSNIINWANQEDSNLSQVSASSVVDGLRDRGEFQPFDSVVSDKPSREI